LIGLAGEKEFTEAWSSLAQDHQPNLSSSCHFVNFKRGKEHEEVARSTLSNDSGLHVKTCGIYFQGEIGGSPEGLIETEDSDWVLEIKTRSIITTGPLEHIEKYMYVQVQTQLHCTGRNYGLLMSYHPETRKASYLVFVDVTAGVGDNSRISRLFNEINCLTRDLVNQYTLSIYQFLTATE